MDVHGLNDMTTLPELMKTFWCAPHNSLENPTYHTQRGGHKTFMALEPKNVIDEQSETDCPRY
eukprot:5729397-Amphidinium_carterae.1